MKLFWLIVCSIMLLFGVVMLSQSIEYTERNPVQKFVEETKIKHIDPAKLKEKTIKKTKSDVEETIKQLRKTMTENRDKIKIETLSLRKINNLLFYHCSYFDGRDQLPMKLQMVCKKLEERRDKITVKENHEELNKYD